MRANRDSNNSWPSFLTGNQHRAAGPQVNFCTIATNKTPISPKQTAQVSFCATATNKTPISPNKHQPGFSDCPGTAEMDIKLPTEMVL